MRPGSTAGEARGSGPHPAPARYPATARRNAMNTHCASETIMVAGDWHGELGWALQVLQRAGKLGVSKLVHVGDLGIGPFPGERGGRYEDKLNRICAKNRVTIFCVPGNHEAWPTIERLEPRADGWLELREHLLITPGGLRWTWSGVEFGALGGAYSVDHAYRTEGRDWWPGLEEVRPEHLDRLGSEPLDVLVTHDVPAGVDLFRAFDVGPATAARAQVSRDLLAEAVQCTGPELVLSGHWHERRTAYLPLMDGAAPGRRTVAERHRGVERGEPRWVTRIEVLDLGAEYVGTGGRTDRNWLLLDLRDLSVEEQRGVEARMRGGDTTNTAASEVDELDVETARGCWVIRSSGSTAYFLDFESWRLLRAPGQRSSTAEFDNVWVPLVSAVNDKGEARITVGSRHKYVLDPEPNSTNYRTWIARACTSINTVARADLPVGVPAPDDAGQTLFIPGSARAAAQDSGTPPRQPDDTAEPT